MRGVRIGGLPVLRLRRGPVLHRFGSRFVFEPVRTRRHDDLVALLFAEAIFAEHAALVLGAVAAVARRAAAIVLTLLVLPAIAKVVLGANWQPKFLKRKAESAVQPVTE